MKQYFVNGFCLAHNKHWQSCSECWNAHQAQQSKRWLDNQRLNAQAVRHFHAVTEQNYRAMCGDPVQTETFR